MVSKESLTAKDRRRDFGSKAFYFMSKRKE